MGYVVRTFHVCSQTVSELFDHKFTPGDMHELQAWFAMKVFTESPMPTPGSATSHLRPDVSCAYMSVMVRDMQVNQLMQRINQLEKGTAILIHTDHNVSTELHYIVRSLRRICIPGHAFYCCNVLVGTPGIRCPIFAMDETIVCILWPRQAATGKVWIRTVDQLRGSTTFNVDDWIILAFWE